VLTIAIVLLLVAPAAAAGGLSLTPSQRTVTGSVLTVVPTGGDAQGGVTLVVTDVAGSQAVFRFAAAAVADGRPLSVDLSAPDGGAGPRNGRATVTLSDSTGTLAQTQVTIDRTPSTPSLNAVVEGRRVLVAWSDVAAADTVTYRLERAVGGAAQVVYEGASTAFTDRDLAPGRVTYALTAGVPGGGGTNWSPPATTNVKIVAPTTPAAPSADAAPGAGAGRVEQAAETLRAKPANRKAARPTRPRRVAASGVARPMGHAAAAIPTVGYASAPWLDASAVPYVVAAPPLVAAPRGSYPTDHIPSPFPTRVLGAAPLAGSATGASSPIMAAAVGLVLLALAAAQGLRSWQERRELQQLVLALARHE
jgi:hypothetical protein